MTNSYLTYTLCLFALLLFQRCSDDSCTQASGERVLSTRSFNQVDYVNLGLSARLNLIEDLTLTSTELSIETEGNIANKISSSLNDGVLSIRFSDCIEKHKDITMTLRYPSLKGVIVSGAGDIYTGNIIRQQTFEVTVNGSGETHLLMDIDSLTTRIGGTGLAEHSGIATHHQLEITGAGDLRSYELFTDSLQADLSASGNAWVRVSKKLDATLSSRGSLYYKGSPTINSTVTGTGQLVEEN